MLLCFVLQRLDVKRLPAEEISPLLVAVVGSMDTFQDISAEGTAVSVSARPPAILPELLSVRKDAMAPQTVVHVMQALVTHLPQILDSHAYAFASQVLQSAMHLFLQMPACFQLVLGRTLHICVECGKTTNKSNPGQYLAACQLSRQAMWYYNLLKCDPSAALAKKSLRNE